MSTRLVIAEQSYNLKKKKKKYSKQKKNIIPGIYLVSNKSRSALKLSEVFQTQVSATRAVHRDISCKNDITETFEWVRMWAYACDSHWRDYTLKPFSLCCTFVGQLFKKYLWIRLSLSELRVCLRGFSWKFSVEHWKLEELTRTTLIPRMVYLYYY